MMAGCYVLHLYCDNPDCPERQGGTPVRFENSEFGSRARARARRAGWKLNIPWRDSGQDLCPKCSGKKPRKT